MLPQYFCIVAQQVFTAASSPASAFFMPTCSRAAHHSPDKYLTRLQALRSQKGSTSRLTCWPQLSGCMPRQACRSRPPRRQERTRTPRSCEVSATRRTGRACAVLALSRCPCFAASAAFSSSVSSSGRPSFRRRSRLSSSACAPPLLSWHHACLPRPATILVSG